MANKKKGSPKAAPLTSAQKANLKTQVTTYSFPTVPVLSALVALLLIALVWVLAGSIGMDEDKNDKPTDANKTQVEGDLVEDPSNPRPQGSVDKHRKEIGKQATALLNQAMEISKQDNFDTIMANLAEGKMEGVPTTYSGKFRFVDKLKDEQEIRAAGLMSILQLGKTIQTGLDSDKKLDYLTPNAWEYVYIDMDAGHAFVPLTLYLGERAAFSLEYVWVDGEWVFSPYSFIDALSSANITAQGANSAAQ